MATDFQLPLSKKQSSELLSFYRKWNVTELCAFGSVTRKEEFTSKSDVDLLIQFSETSSWGLLDFVRMEDELTQILKRKVDLISKKAVQRSKNEGRKKSILESAQVLYAA